MDIEQPIADISKSEFQEFLVRCLVPLAVLCILAAPIRAQEPRTWTSRFDPVTYIGSLKIHQEWTDGSLPAPPNADISFRDTIRVNNPTPIAFTAVVTERRKGGWVLALEYDADRSGSLRLMRIRAHAAVVNGAEEEFAALDRRIGSILGRRVLNRAELDAHSRRWQWAPRDGYALTLSRSPRGLHLLLDRLPENSR